MSRPPKDGGYVVFTQLFIEKFILLSLEEPRPMTLPDA
jgi:hypothetical protein